jgi:hypothetical protein
MPASKAVGAQTSSADLPRMAIVAGNYARQKLPHHRGAYSELD